MREITSHIVNPVNDKITIHAVDDPGPGGASHVYAIGVPERAPLMIAFQKGGIAESGINGITQEVLLAIVEDRLASFQAGPFPSDANAVALAAVRSAQAALAQRTRERMARGVEGKAVA